MVVFDQVGDLMGDDTKEVLTDLKEKLLPSCKFVLAFPGALEVMVYDS
jgi:hypothetical protein